MATWKLESDDDEFFGSSAEEERERICTDGFEVHSGLAQADASALKERHKVIGYHETYDAARDSALQPGFEAGYTDHFDASQRIGITIGRLVMNAKLKESKETNRNNATIHERESIHLQALLLTKDHLTAGSVQDNKNDKSKGYEKNSLEELERKLSNITLSSNDA